MIYKFKIKKNIKEWHDWFAWHPVYVGNGYFVWLKNVQRKGTLCYGRIKTFTIYWRYKLKEK